MKKSIFIIAIIFFLIDIGAFAQQDTIRGTYSPYDQKTSGNRNDTIAKVKVIREKPNSMLGKILYYLGPTKYDMVDSVYPMYTDDDLFYIHQNNHSLQTERNLVDTANSEIYWNRRNKISGRKIRYEKDTTRQFTKQVYGYHPYWMGTAYESYDFTLLTRVAYFSYILNPRSGNSKTSNFWSSTKMIDLAHQYGCAVDLCITNFGANNNKVFLTNKVAQQKLIINIIASLRQRKGDGVNINFEAIPKINKTDFNEFIKLLRAGLDKTGAGYKITITIPAIDWRNAYDVGFLKDYVDYFFLMGYDFYGKYSKVAGPTSLLFSGADWGENNVNNTINNYLEFGAKPESMILGLPYYGNEWITTDGQVPSAAKKYVGSRTYSYINKHYADKYVAHYDSTSHSIYYIFRDSVNWVQCWTDNEQTLGIKYDYINEKGLGGLGIWALGYDNSFPELWTLIKEKFTAPVDTSPSLHSRLSSTLEYSVTNKTMRAISKTSPGYAQRFNDGLSTGWKIFTLLFIIIMLFTIVGFIIAVADFDVRFALFNQEARSYLFFTLLAILTLLIFRVMGVLQNYELMLVFSIIFGIATALILLNVGKEKKADGGKAKP